ncbi:competence/damage-inducible protein A, partial [Candidatus Aerophobetes bacterium]|nr:competence/damage-inducible protein A [Candidatus Aerophobetes bacterium]
MKAEIICVGTELLLGEVIDTNSAYIAKAMSRLGINIFRKTVVG